MSAPLTLLALLIELLVGYPEHDEELTVVQRSLTAPPELRRVLELDRLLELQAAAVAVYVDPGIVSYTVQLATADGGTAGASDGSYTQYTASGGAQLWIDDEAVITFV